MSRSAGMELKALIDSVNAGNPKAISVDEIRRDESKVEIRINNSKAIISSETYRKIKDYLL